jgi:hypothetical protein
MNEADLEDALFPKAADRGKGKIIPDWSYINQELNWRLRMVTWGIGDVANLYNLRYVCCRIWGTNLSARPKANCSVKRP